MGNIGRRLAQLLIAIGMRVIAYDPFVSRETANQLGVELANLPELIPQSEGLFMTASPAPNTIHLLNAPLLDLIRSDAVLVSVSRASLIDHEALVERLAAGRSERL